MRIKFEPNKNVPNIHSWIRFLSHKQSVDNFSLQKTQVVLTSCLTSAYFY